VVIAQREVWWADLAELRGSEAGFRRPVIVVQSDALNRVGLATTVVVPLTANLKWAAAPGNVRLDMDETGLTKDSVALCPLMFAANRSDLVERAGQISARRMREVFAALDIVFGR
jgi:mRNA interferase MazF